MKKGFTLIELLAVIIILGVLVAIATVVVTNHINDSKTAAFNVLVASVKDSAEQYVTRHASDFGQLTTYDPNNNIFYIGLGALVYDGYLQEPVIDPRTRQTIPLTTQIKITVNSTSNINIDFMYN